MGMTPYYAELSFGGTTLHLSGSADDGIPDGLGIAKEGIEGLLSSPALKVTATERSYGNGGHDVAESDVQYAARTLSVHFLAMGNGRSDAMAHLNAVAAATGRVVRLRVVDAQRDVYCVGYCQRDVEATWSDGRFTGTLTIVCQRPELLSWRAQSAQLMPVSRSRGGLSYGIPQYECSWTGTPNASTSTLSQDGNVVATNQYINPRLVAGNMKAVNYSSGSAPTIDNYGDMNLNIADGESLSIHDSNPTAMNSFAFQSITLPAGALHFHGEVRTTGYFPTGAYDSACAIYSQWAYSKNNVTQNRQWVTIDGDFTLDQTTNTELHLKTPNNSWTRWRNVGVYLQSDWQAMQALGVNWFSGSAQNPRANSGLSYGPGNKGLSYGVAADGGERNLTVLSNHGSYPAYPTLVVNGPFPDGVEIQTGVGGSIRYSGSIGMVPLTIQCDPRNVAASMGGVDVGRYLVGRDLPSIPSGGSLSLRLVTAGSGWVTCSVHDTYL